MGTHPIFESDFDCLTGIGLMSGLYFNAQFIDKSVSFYPKPQISPDERDEVKAHLSSQEQQQLRAVHRGHLGIPEEIMKAGAAQYASMCNNINNKFMLSNKKHMVIPEFASVLEMLSVTVRENFSARPWTVVELNSWTILIVLNRISAADLCFVALDN